MNLEILNRKVTQTQTHTHTTTHTDIKTRTRSGRPDFARTRGAYDMCAAVCGQPLYMKIARFVLSKKCLGEDAQEFRMLISRSANRLRSIPVSFQNGVDEIIVF